MDLPKEEYMQTTVCAMYSERGNGGEFGLDCEEYVHTGLQTDWAHCLLHKHLCAACQPSSLCNSSKSFSYV